MKKMLKKINSKVTFFNYFLIATVIGIAVLFVTIFCNVNYVKDITKSVRDRQIRTEHILKDIKSQNKIEILSNIKDKDLTNDNFIKEYYTIQSDWLNKWLTALAIIMAILGIMIPICFVKFLENKEKEMDRIIEDTKKQKDEMQLQVAEMENQLISVKKESKEITTKSQKISQELEEVKDYVNKAKALSKYNEGLSKLQEDTKDKTKQSVTLQLYTDAHNLDPENPKYLYAIGNLNLYMNERDLAIQYLRKAIEIQEKPHYYYDLFIAYYEKRDYENAINISSKILKLKDTNNLIKAQTYSILAIIYSYKKDIKNCILNIEKSFKQGFESNIIYCNVGLAYINIEKYKEAIDILEQNNKKYPKYKDYYNLTEAYVLTHNFDKALKHLQMSLADKNSTFTYLFKDDFIKWNNELDKAEPSEIIDNIKQIISNLEQRNRE